MLCKKTICALLLTVTAFLGFTAVAEPGGSHILIAYFSATGTTAPLAEYAADILNADLYEIVPEQTYTEADLAYYTDGRCDREQADDSARPAIVRLPENLEQYDVIFIGYPIWHGRMPQAIHTFMESYDLTGKTVIPFNTHEGSGQSGTQSVIENALPNSTVLQGLAVQGKTAQEDEARTQELIAAWLESLNWR